MKKLIFLIGLLFLCSCSHKIMAPETTWQQIPCEYKLTGDDLSTLNVRTEITEFDSAKVILNTLAWTVAGDTTSNSFMIFLYYYETINNYIVFTINRSLPINTVLRSVELWFKK